MYPPVATVAGGGKGHGFDPGEQRAGGGKAFDQTAAKDNTPHTVLKIHLVIKHFEKSEKHYFLRPWRKTVHLQLQLLRIISKHFQECIVSIYEH